MSVDPATELPQPLDEPEIPVLPGAYDAMSPKRAERTGLETVDFAGVLGTESFREHHRENAKK